MIFCATGGRMGFATRSEGGVWQDSGSRCGNATFLYLSHFFVVIPCESALPCRTGEKEGDESMPPQKSGGACDPDSGTEWHTAIRPHAGSLSSPFIPAGRLGNRPPGGALKEGRQTYELARAGPFFEGALAPARWPHELEKPDPGFGRGGLVGLSRVWCSWYGPGGASSASLWVFLFR